MGAVENVNDDITRQRLDAKPAASNEPLAVGAFGCQWWDPGAAKESPCEDINKPKAIMKMALKVIQPKWKKA